MSDKDQISSSLRAMYGDATTYHDSPTIEGQGGLLDSMFPSSQVYVKNDAEFLHVHRGVSETAKAMKEPVHQRQGIAKPNIQNPLILPIPNDGVFIPFTELGFCRSSLDTFQCNQSPALSMDVPHHAEALDAAERPVSMKVTGQPQAWTALSRDMRTSPTEIRDMSFPSGEVARRHHKRTFTTSHATCPHNLACDRAAHTPEVGFSSARSRFPGQTLSHAAFTYTSGNRYGHTMPRNEIVGPPVLSFMSGGIKHYRCECGYESARKRDIDRHLESLQHSERKYECSCGKKFTRSDSLHRHRKRKTQKSMGSKA